MVLGNVTQLVYDAAGRRTALTDSLGNVSRWEYDALGRTIATTDPLGHVSRFHYDAAGRVVETVDALGNSRQTEYNALGWLIRQLDPLGRAFSQEHDAAGNAVATRDALGNVTRFEYDLAGRLVATVDPSGARVAYEYAGGPAWTQMTDPLGNRTERVFDRNGRVIAETRYLDGAPVTNGYSYDALGNKASETDAAGNATSYAYDPRGRMTGMRDALGGQTTYGYDAVGRLAAITDPKGSVSRREYDRAGRMTAEVDALGNRTEYSYDAGGNLVGKQTADGLSAALTYDANRRLLREDWPGTVDDIFYSYDALGRKVTASGEVNGRPAAVAYAYDAAGEVTKVDYGWLGSVAYQYDAAGNRTKLTDSYGGEVNYRYDPTRRLAALNDGGEYAFAYNAAGLRTGLNYPNGVTATTDYNALGWVTRYANSDVNRFDYTYDILGNRLTVTDDRGVNRFGYDALSRLTSAEYPNGNYERFTYDSVGNRLLLQTAVDTTIYTYNQGHQLVAEGGKVYEYDPRGNLISITGLGTANTYAYTPRNRMTRGDSGSLASPSPLGGEGQSEGAISNLYGYGPDGERWFVKKSPSLTSPSPLEGEGWGEGAIRYFLYDREDLICELDENLRLVTRYTHGLGIDEPLKMTEYDTAGSIVQTSYLHRDALGSVTGVSDGNGAVVALYHYAAFGAPAEAGDLRYRFTSREWEGDLYLYYYRARMYQPNAGRFTAYDPIANAVGVGYDPYSYCGNNPLRYTDPEGMAWSGMDFWNHFIGATGTEVKFGNIGLLGEYQSRTIVKNFIIKVKDDVENMAVANTPAAISGSFDLPVVATVPVLNFTTPVQHMAVISALGNYYFNHPWQYGHNVDPGVVAAFAVLDPLDVLGRNTLFATPHLQYTRDCVTRKIHYSCGIKFNFRDPFDELWNNSTIDAVTFSLLPRYKYFDMTAEWSEYFTFEKTF